MGDLFLYKSGNNADAIVQASRILPMLITLLVVIFIYLLARGIMGAWWALLPAALFAFSPTVIAHGHYVTTDLGAAFGIIFATYYFLKFIESPSRKHLWYAGLSFGVAQITKFSAPFLVILFAFLVFILWLRSIVVDWSTTAQRIKTFFVRGGRWLWRLALIFAIGYVCIVYPIYFLFTINYPIQKQVSDTTFILGSFGGGPTPPGARCIPARCLANLDIWMSGQPVFRPLAEYMLGILMVLQRSDGGNTMYFLGQVRGTGGPSYFPLLFVLKEAIPTLIIVFTALVLALWWMLRRDREGRSRLQRMLDYIGVNFAEFSMMSFIVLYWGYSMRSPLNIGFRHLMPTIPFIYILAASVWRKWTTNIDFAKSDLSLAAITLTLRSLFTSTLKYAVLVALIFWIFLETLIAGPHFLSYFNEFGGGTWNGYRYVTDSNYDWGQDLLRLKQWVATHPEVDTIAVDYFGGGSPKYYLGNKEVDWSSSKGNPADQGIHWLAVSINTLEGAMQPLAPGQSRKPEDSYEWLRSLRPPASGMGEVPPPDARAGTSIFIYRL
jgi:4-amino-4-deoxy-L-arabinose transferase-like glycosyltransferase